MSTYLIDLHIYIASMAVFEIITLFLLTNEINLISAMKPEFSPKPVTIRRQDHLWRNSNFRYSYAPMHPYPMAHQESSYVPQYAYPTGRRHPYMLRKPPPYYPIPASSMSYASYSSNPGPPKPISAQTVQLVSKYAPPPKRFYVPKYYLKPIPVPTPYIPQYPPRPRRQRPVNYERFNPNEAISKEIVKEIPKETSETKVTETKSKPNSNNNNNDEAYVEIGGIGYKTIWNTLSNSLSNVKLGTDNSEDDENDNSYERVKQRKVKFKLGTSRKPSPFIQFGQSRVSFQQDNHGGVTITLGKADS